MKSNTSAMRTITINAARTSLNRQIDRVPILISGEHANAVLVSKADWEAIQEYAAEPFSVVGREHFPAAVASGLLLAKCCRPTANWTLNKA